MPEHLYIFVNGCVFDASNGVKEFMNRGEIAGLVGIARASAVVHLEARIEPKDLRIDAVPSRDVQHSGVRVTHLPSGFVVAHLPKGERPATRNETARRSRKHTNQNGFVIAAENREHPLWAVAHLSLMTSSRSHRPDQFSLSSL